MIYFVTHTNYEFSTKRSEVRWSTKSKVWLPPLTTYTRVPVHICQDHVSSTLSPKSDPASQQVQRSANYSNGIEEESVCTESKLLEEACKVQTSKSVASILVQPSWRFAGFILRGTEFGFRVGFNGKKVVLNTVESTWEHPRVVQKYLNDELAYKIGCASWASRGLKTSFGVIPGPTSGGLSSPDGHNLNEEVSKELSSLPMCQSTM